MRDYSNSILRMLHIVLMIIAILFSLASFYESKYDLGIIMLILDFLAYFYLFKLVKKIYYENEVLLSYLMTISSIFLYIFLAYFSMCVKVGLTQGLKI